MDLENILDNQYVSTSLAVFLVLYGGLASPKLSKCMIKLFSNPLFRLLIIFLIAYTSSKNHSIALVATIVLILVIQESKESTNIESKENVISSKSKVVVSKFKIDEEEEKTNGEIIHILKDKSTITESKLASSVINDEISKLQSDNLVSENELEESIDKPNEIIEDNKVATEPIDKPNETIEDNKVATEPIDKANETIEDNKVLPMPMDKTENSHGIEIIDNDLSKDLNTEVENKKCNDCDKIVDYEIDTNDIVLGYDGNGFFNFKNL
tara:strand:+ start:824 stop:1627 length:804 start_codon:yes stop_codon:yes gene_type:complete